MFVRQKIFSPKRPCPVGAPPPASPPVHCCSDFGHWYRAEQEPFDCCGAPPKPRRMGRRVRRWFVRQPPGGGGGSSSVPDPNPRSVARGQGGVQFSSGPQPPQCGPGAGGGSSSVPDPNPRSVARGRGGGGSRAWPHCLTRFAFLISPPPRPPPPLPDHRSTCWSRGPAAAPSRRRRTPSPNTRRPLRRE